MLNEQHELAEDLAEVAAIDLIDDEYIAALRIFDSSAAARISGRLSTDEGRAMRQTLNLAAVAVNERHHRFTLEFRFRAISVIPRKRD
jgi:hypothetical protein